jgi:ABC-type multidrug transport system fused ATPase/permease subunit
MNSRRFIIRSPRRRGAKSIAGRRWWSHGLSLGGELFDDLIGDGKYAYVRFDSAKVNIAPNSQKATWFKLVRLPVPHPLQVRGSGVLGSRAGVDRGRSGALRRLRDGNTGLRASPGAPRRAGCRMSGAPPIVDVEGLTVDFLGGSKPLRAVGGVDLTLRAGEVLALLGESGSGRRFIIRSPDRRWLAAFLGW